MTTKDISCNYSHDVEKPIKSMSDLFDMKRLCRLHLELSHGVVTLGQEQRDGGFTVMTVTPSLTLQKEGLKE